jgi:hypothetical protein
VGVLAPIAKEKGSPMSSFTPAVTVAECWPLVEIDARGLSARVESIEACRVRLAWRLPLAARTGPLEVDGATHAERRTIWISIELDAPGAVVVRRPADIDGDGFVDAADLSVLLGDWSMPEARSDLNIDGTVDAADHALLLGAWGTHTKDTP